MLKKSRVFLSCMALAGAGFGAAAGFGAEEARAAEMIRPEDEALLADIFAPAGSAEVSGGRAAVSGQRYGDERRPRREPGAGGTVEGYTKQGGSGGE